jgi:hypothetical protein
MSNKRVGGLQRIDPAVNQWQQEAAENRSALTKKQKRDRARIGIKVEVSAEFKQQIIDAANEVGTSQSQFTSFILHWAMREWAADGDCGKEIRELMYQAKTPARTPKFDWNLDLTVVGGE